MDNSLTFFLFVWVKNIMKFSKHKRINESLDAEREQVRKIHNMSFRHLGILLLTEEYQIIF
jgi:hypothetical protein